MLVVKTEEVKDFVLPVMDPEIVRDCGPLIGHRHVGNVTKPKCQRSGCKGNRQNDGDGSKGKQQDLVDPFPQRRPDAPDALGGGPGRGCRLVNRIYPYMVSSSPIYSLHAT